MVWLLLGVLIGSVLTMGVMGLCAVGQYDKGKKDGIYEGKMEGYDEGWNVGFQKGKEKWINCMKTGTK